MTTTNPAVYTFPRDRESKAEPVKVDTESKAPGDRSPFPAVKCFASSITSLLMNIGGVEEAEVPELTLLNTDRIQIWFDDTHLIESDSRRATVGKYYLTPLGEPTLYRVANIDKRSVEEYSHDISDRAKQTIDRPADELTLEYCYALTDRGRGPYDGIDECLPRVMFERDGSIPGYMDPPPIPFEKVSGLSDADESAGTHSRKLSEFK
jgi:hypothetical protein